LHSKLTPASASVNAKVTLYELVVSGGCWVIAGVGGGCVSTVHVHEAGLLRFPAASRASTWNVCEASERPEYDFGLEQGENWPPSSLHRNVTPVSGSLKEKLAFAELEKLGGFAVIVGAGGACVSIVKTEIAGEFAGVWLPSPSVART
jgi:hypothetical protein